MAQKREPPLCQAGTKGPDPGVRLTTGAGLAGTLTGAGAAFFGAALAAAAFLAAGLRLGAAFFYCIAGLTRRLAT